MMEEKEEAEAAAEQRNWAELPTDALSVIYQKLGAIGILQSAEGVCRPWRQLALHPHTWRCISIVCTVEDAIPMEELARKAIDRSFGHLQKFYAENFGSDQLLDYIADRASELKSFAMIIPRCITPEALAKFIGRCPVLERCEVVGEVTEFGRGSIGRQCAEMKLFGVVWLESEKFWWGDQVDAMALEIADTMPQLRLLNLCENSMSNKGLHAILDKCLHLEYLDIRGCSMLKLDVDAGLRAKLAKIKTLMLRYEAEKGEEEEAQDRENL